MSAHVLHLSPIGKAIKSARNIKKGELILVDTGIITRKQTKYSYQVDWDRHFEPQGPSAFINHSCRPNMGIKIKAGAIPEFYAMRNISKGEELCVDYATFEYKTKFLSKTNCMCGAPGCRGKIVGFVGLTGRQAEAYGEFLADYLQKKKAVELQAA